MALGLPHSALIEQLVAGLGGGKKTSRRLDALEAAWREVAGPVIAHYETTIAGINPDLPLWAVTAQAAVEVNGRYSAEEDRHLRDIVREIVATPGAEPVVGEFFFRQVRPAVMRGFARRHGREAPELCDQAAADWLAPLRSEVMVVAAAENFRRRFVDVFRQVATDSGRLLGCAAIALFMSPAG